MASVSKRAHYVAAAGGGPTSIYNKKDGLLVVLVFRFVSHYFL